MGTDASGSSGFPELSLPKSVKEPWMLGWRKHWNDLELALKPIEGFRITNAATEAHVAIIRKMFDESTDANGNGILHEMLLPDGGDNDALLQKLLALGLNPDIEKNEKGYYRRPSHECGVNARLKCAEAISLCRPNLHARQCEKNMYRCTPAEAARFSYWDSDPNFPEVERAKVRLEVAQVWENAEKNGFPSIAKMASNKQWFAVQNLCRRGVICRFTEGSAQFCGKTAVEWAVHHGEKSLAEELRYYLLALGHTDSQLTEAIGQLKKIEGIQTVQQLNTQTLQRDTEALQKESKDIKRSVEALGTHTDTKLTEAMGQLKKIEGTQTVQQQKTQTLQRDTEALQKESKDIKQSVEDVEQELDEIKNNLGSTKILCQESQESLAFKTQEMVESLKEEFLEIVVSLRENCTKQEGDMRIMQLKINSLEAEVVERDSQLQKLRNSLKNVKEKQKDMEDDIEDLESTMEDLQGNKNQKKGQTGPSGGARGWQK